MQPFTVTPMAKQSEVAILTLVSNASGYGPGHSAIVVQGTVYSFEQIKGPFGDSWLVMPVKEYLAINEHRPVLVHCAGGYRSSVAASLLQRHGFTDVSEIAGGLAAWEAAGLPVVKP